MAVAGRRGSAAAVGGTAEAVGSHARVASVASDAGVEPADLLLRLVPRLAAEWAATGPADQPWRVVDGTLVFADISGFTALSERLAKQGPIGAEELTEVLGRCFADLLAVAYARGGSLVKFGGDALLLLFDGDGHAVRGVDAALGMRSTMRRVGRLSTSVGNVRLRMSLGVHTGPVHAFLVGGSHRELLLAGPGPSAVVTMEGTADAGEIVVSPATASRIDAALLAGAKGPGVLLRPRVEGGVVVDDGGTYPVRTVTADVAACVPVALRDHLSAGGAESEHRHAAIAFLHFDGTDGLLLERGPAWVAGALDALVRDVQDACERQGATFLASDLDHDGGKLILVGGVPRTLGDDDGRVLRAVREIVDAAADRGDDGIPVRVGVNRGPVFAGEVGPPYRRTFTVMGDAVNLAARLMAKASRGEVLASAGVLDRSRTAFSTAALEPFFVKGKSRPVQAYAVGAAAGVHHRRDVADLPLLGREAPLQVLQEAWRTVGTGAGDGRGVVFEGDVGIGKTRLVEELRLLAGSSSTRVVSCEQYEQSTPFFSFRVLLQAVLGLHAAATEAHFADAIASVDPSLLEWLPLLGDVCNIRCAETPATSHLEPQFRRLRTTLVVDQLLASALREPVVLAFDDVHWMDASSRDILLRLLGNVAQRPWVICTTTRDAGDGDELAAAGPGVVRRVRLEPLDDTAARSLVREATTRGGAALPPHRVDAVVARAEGNPLFLEELLAVAGDDDGQLPESLEAVACTQIDRLPVDAGRVLRVASVLGVSFDGGLFTAVLDASAIHGDPLAGLQEHLRQEPDGRVRFRHRLIRDAAYELLPFRRRRQLHHLAARTIEGTAGDGAEDVAEVLTLHYAAAQDHEATWRHARVAGERAVSKGALHDAVAHYERALSAARHLTDVERPAIGAVWEELAVNAAIAGLHDRARAALREARRLLADDAIASARLCFREARFADRHGRSQDVVRWIRRGLRHLDGVADDPDAAARRALLLALYAYCRQQSGRPREAIRWARRVVDEQQAVEASRLALAMAYLVLAWAHIDLGQAEQATYATSALELYEDLGEFGELGIALNNLGAFAYFQGRWQDALSLYGRSTENFQKIGDVMDAALSVANRAEILTLQGRLDEAEELLTEIIDLWSAMAFPYGLAIAHRHLGRVRLRQGRLDEAQELLRTARTTFDLYQQAGKLVEIDAWLAECLLRQGDIRQAVSLIDGALERERAGGGSEMAPMLHRLAGYAAAAERRVVDAWASFDTSLHIARGRGAAFDVALALEGMAIVARLGGPAVEPDHEAERAALLADLGVVVVAPPPVALSA
jgi:class 3 adenylate cyclase/tetratricopeptide (TPR) repeat protein